MDRYYLFRKLMDLVAEECEITDADMKNYNRDIEVSGRFPGGEITVTAKLVEVEQDA